MGSAHASQQNVVIETLRSEINALRDENEKLLHENRTHAMVKSERKPPAAIARSARLSQACM
jgi:hypothetical protein